MTADLALTTRLTQAGLLDRFEARAIQWAEQAGIRWIELEGELWTLVSELERKKGVEPGDFTTNTKPSYLSEALLEKQGEPPAALQRLLQQHGVKRASIPTTFSVEGGYALSCGGPGAKAGITALVRQQIPEWALAGYTLVNVPLALSYLMHGRSDVAKATRDLTVGTTIDVGKVAAARENASIAVMPYAEGISKSQVALLHYLQALQEEQAQTRDVADKAHQRADDAFATANHASIKADKAISLVLGSNRQSLHHKSKQPSKFTRHALYETWRKHYDGICPCCHSAVDPKNLEVDHWSTKQNADAAHLWLVCRGCNTRMGSPVFDGGRKRTDLDGQRFRTFQDLLGLPVVVQGDLGLSA